jgi:hypothetical protein
MPPSTQAKWKSERSDPEITAPPRAHLPTLIARALPPHAHCPRTPHAPAHRPAPSALPIHPAPAPAPPRASPCALRPSHSPCPLHPRPRASPCALRPSHSPYPCTRALPGVGCRTTHRVLSHVGEARECRGQGERVARRALREERARERRAKRRERSAERSSEERANTRANPRALTPRPRASPFALHPSHSPCPLHPRSSRIRVQDNTSLLSHPRGRGARVQRARRARCATGDARRAGARAKGASAAGKASALRNERCALREGVSEERGGRVRRATSRRSLRKERLPSNARQCEGRLHRRSAKSD